MENSNNNIISRAAVVPFRPPSFTSETPAIVPIERVDGLQSKLRSAGGGGESETSYTNYTFMACVDGEPKTFVIPIVSGPTDPE